MPPCYQPLPGASFRLKQNSKMLPADFVVCDLNSSRPYMEGTMGSSKNSFRIITGVIAIMAALVGFMVIHAQAQSNNPPPPPKSGGSQGVVSTTLGF
jgi:hypothetical protein